MFLSNKEIRTLGNEIASTFGVEDFFEKRVQVEVREDIVYKNKEPVFFYLNGRLFPHLKLLHKTNFLKMIVVDMPAIPFMAKGAAVMRPGIKEINEFIAKDEIVAIVDERNKKAVAVGVAEFTGKEMIAMQKGKVVKNLHWVGDKIWNA